MLFPQDQWAYSCKPLAASMDEKGCLLHFAPGNGFFSVLHLARIFSWSLCCLPGFAARWPAAQSFRVVRTIGVAFKYDLDPQITTWIHQVDWLIHRTYQVTDMT